jgi:PAS domain S-box-containing protein
MTESNALVEAPIPFHVFNRFFLASGLPTYLYDARTRQFVSLSRSASRLYGYSETEFLSMCLDDIDVGLPPLDSRTQAESLSERPARHRLKSGSIVDVRISNCAVSSEGRELIGVLVKLADASPRAGLGLDSGPDVLPRASHVVAAAAWSFDPRERLFTYSDEFCQQHGWPKGRRFMSGEALEWCAPESRAEVQQAFRACLMRGAAFDLEFTTLGGKTGRSRMRMTGHAVRDEKDAVCLVEGVLQDITRQKLAEDELRALASRPDPAGAIEAFMTLDREWKFTYVSKGAERLLQRPGHELVGRLVWDACPQIKGTLLEQKARLAMTSREPVRLEASYPTLLCWLDIHLRPSDDGLTAYVRDVASRRPVDGQLRLLETCVSCITDVVIVTTAASSQEQGHRIVFVNDAFIRCTGYSRSEVIGRSPRMLQGPKTDRTELDRIRYALGRHEPVRAELINYTKAGREYWTELEIVPVLSTFGEPTHFVAVQRDSTLRRRAQEELRGLNDLLEVRVADRTAELEVAYATLAAKEEEMRSVMENIAECIITFDEHGVITSANPLLVSIFGYEPGEAVGMDIATLIPGLGVPAAGDAGIAPRTRDARGLHRNGDVIALETAISEYVIKGRRRYTIVLRDIQERLAIMADLVQSRHAAEQASLAKSQFVATMSHEIRTPMNGVVGMLEMLARPRLDDDQGRMMNVVRESARALMVIIDDILDFSKIEAGKVDIESRPLSVGAVVESACELARQAPGHSDAELSFSIDPLVPRLLLGDEARLRQVLLNLIGNALKFTKGHRSVARVVVNVGLEAQEDPPTSHVVLAIAVEDNGIGIESSTLERLFRPFSQADASTTRRFGGTGLGLAICQQLVELMGGSILVESTPNVGSTFTVRLPCPVVSQTLLLGGVGKGPAEALAERPGTTATYAGGAGSILVAEDNEINRQVIAEQLKALGYSATVVSSGAEALASWRSGAFAVLMTDLHMPDMDGYELTARIRAEERGSGHTPIIAFTANALSDEADRCRSAGMNEYLTKPAQLASIDLALERCLRQTWLRERGLRPHEAFPHGPAPVDEAALPRLIGADPRGLSCFYSEFGLVASKSAAVLDDAVRRRAYGEVAATAHALKGSAASIGALRLAEFCAEVEEGARAGDASAVDGGWVAFGIELAAVRRWIDAFNLRDRLNVS